MLGSLMKLLARKSLNIIRVLDLFSHRQMQLFNIVFSVMLGAHSVNALPGTPPPAAYGGHPHAAIMSRGAPIPAHTYTPVIWPVVKPSLAVRAKNWMNTHRILTGGTVLAASIPAGVGLHRAGHAIAEKVK